MSEKISVLMIAPSFYPPGNPESFVNANLVLAMLEKGWNVKVIYKHDHSAWYPTSHKKWDILKAVSHDVMELSPSRFNRYRMAGLSLLLSGQLTSGVLWAIPAAIEAVKLSRANKYDVLITRALPHTAHYAGLIVSCVTGIPWIANWNDPVPWDKFPKEFKGGGGSNARLGFLSDRFYNKVAKKADFHTFPCGRLRNYINSYLSTDIYSKSFIVPHVMPHWEIDPSNYKANDIFTIIHAGSIAPPRYIDTFFEALNLFAKDMKNIRVKFVVDKSNIIIEAAKKYSVSHLIDVHPSKPYPEMGNVLSSADVLLILELNIEEGIFLPSKFVDYASTGKPILAVSPIKGTISDIIEEYGGGIVADVKCPQRIALALDTLYKQWEIGSLYDNYSSYRLCDQFKEENILACYDNLISKIK